MEVELVFTSPLDYIISAVRTCYQSQKKSSSYYNLEGKFVFGAKDKALLLSIIENDHQSVLEHSMITYKLEGFSRGMLQELSRHRIGVSPSVKSTRFTLKELKDEESFDISSGFSIADDKYTRACKYLVMTGVEDIDICSILALENVRKMIVKGYPNDKVKYCLPESYKTSGQYTFNIRSLRNLFKLRTSPAALWEFREMAFKMYECLDDNYRLLCNDVIYKESFSE